MTRKRRKKLRLWLSKRLRLFANNKRKSRRRKTYKSVVYSERILVKRRLLRLLTRRLYKKQLKHRSK